MRSIRTRLKGNFKARGFTLIELLVVIAIIAILASIILASLGQARSKSRDARRVADLKQIQLALELYNNDNGGYPVLATFGNISGIGASLAPSYISVMPSDPGSYAYQYESLADSTAASATCSSGPCLSYLLRAQLENNNASILNSSATGSQGGQTCGVSGTTYYYCVRP